MGEQQGTEKWRSTVTKCTFATTFMRGQEEVAIYEIEAVDESGGPIEGKKLRSFEQLPIGELRPYNVSVYDHETHGTVYTLRPVKAGSALGPKVDDLRSRIEQLESEEPAGGLGRLSKLERQVQWLLEQEAKRRGGPTDLGENGAASSRSETPASAPMSPSSATPADGPDF